jgi:glutamate-1-semialdehyde 2,1-aminomutase
MGCVPPAPGYLERLRELTEARGILLIFDEVMTGFRVALGGAQELYGVTPDLTTLGKIAGGGMPLAAYGGRADVMERIAPLGPVYQAGTLSGNPVAVAAGLTTLKILQRDPPYAVLDQRTARLADGFVERASAAGIPYTCNRVGSMFTGFFRAGAVTNYKDAQASDLKRFARWHEQMLAHGIHWAPSQFEAAFVSLAHDDALIDETLQAAEAAFATLPEPGVP